RGRRGHGPGPGRALLPGGHPAAPPGRHRPGGGGRDRTRLAVQGPGLRRPAERGPGTEGEALMSVVRSETRDGVCTVTLCDTEHRNALGRALITEMIAAFEAAEADDDVRVIVLTNEGSAFCAGANLSERSSSSSDDAPAAVSSPMHLFGRFARSPKPYVGRIAGHCVAGGMGLAAAMDISVAVEEAKFGFTEVRIGVAPAVISVVCLPKLRTSDARATFLRGQRFTAVEAAEMGLINAAVPADRLDAE